MQDVTYSRVMRVVGAAARLVSSLDSTVFCFHSVTPVRAAVQQETSLSISADFLAALSRRLRRSDIEIISIAEALARRRSGTKGRFAVLTFDDGYRDNAEVLHPLMERLRAPYAIFVTTALVNGTMPLWWDGLERLIHDEDRIILDGEVVALPPPRKAAMLSHLGAAFKARDEVGQRALLDAIVAVNPRLSAYRPYNNCLSWSALRTIAASPFLTIGAHTRSHPVLARLDRGAIREELAASRQEIADRLGRAVNYLAYPYGQPHEYGPDAPDVAKEVGYEAAFTTSHGNWFNPTLTDYTLPRVLIANKARHPDVPFAYMSPWPRRLKAWAGSMR